MAEIQRIGLNENIPGAIGQGGGGDYQLHWYPKILPVTPKANRMIAASYTCIH